MEYYIKTLINDIRVLEECVADHKKYSKEKWYTSKSAIRINGSIEGYGMFTEFTLKECKDVLALRKSTYEAFIKVSEEALKSAINNKNESFGKPFCEDLERKNVIIEDNPIAV